MTISDKYGVSVAKRTVLGAWDIILWRSAHGNEHSFFLGKCIFSDPTIAKQSEAEPLNFTGPAINQSITHPTSLLTRGRGPFSLASVLSGFGFGQKLLIRHQAQPRARKTQGEYFIVDVRGFQSWVWSMCCWLCCSHPPTHSPVALYTH